MKMKILESLLSDDEGKQKGSSKLENNINLHFSPGQNFGHNIPLSQHPSSVLSPYHNNLHSALPGPVLGYPQAHHQGLGPNIIGNEDSFQ